MKTYINLQTSKTVIETNVNSIEEFRDFVSSKIRTNGSKLYVVMNGEAPITKFPIEVYITPSPTDIEQWFEFVKLGSKIFIQEFEQHDYKDAIEYLVDLYELKEPCTPEFLSAN